MINNIKKNFIIIVSIWITILFSINSGFYSITNLFYYSGTFETYFINLINSLRWILPIIILPYLLKLSFSKEEFDLFSLNLIFISFFYIFHIFVFNREMQSMANDFSVTGPQIIDNINLLSCYILTILVFVFVMKKYKQKIFFFNKIFFSFLFLISIYLFYEILLDVYRTDTFILYYNQALQPATNYFDQPAPRVTGWSRTVLLIFMIYFFYNELNQIKKKYYVFNFIILLLVATLIILSQTRGSLVGFILMFILFIAIPKINLTKKFYVTLLFFLIPFSILISIDSFSLKENSALNRYKTTFNQFGTKEKTLNVNNENNVNSVNSVNNEKKSVINTSNSNYSLSSGRFEIWEKSLEVVLNEKKIFGFGPQGDRYILTKIAKNELEASWSNNSSNAIIYSIISGGVIGLISILIIYLSLFIIFLKTIKRIFFEKNIDFRLISSFSIFCYIISRSFFENGFAVFGIDFCALITSYYLIKSELFNPNKS